MKCKFWIGAALIGSAGVVAVWAGIPEPDALLYGRVFVDLVVQQAADDVTVVARVDKPPVDNFPGEEDLPVGLYHIGDLASAAGECDGADCYVLRIKLESAVDGSPVAVDAAEVGDTVRLCIRRGSGDESCDPTDSFVVPNRGHNQEVTIGNAPLFGDWNGDQRVELSDYSHWVECMQGPKRATSAQCVAVFDSDGDADVDLSDVDRFLNVLASSTRRSE